MKQPMTQRYYNLLTSAGMLEPCPKLKRQMCDYCLCTTPNGVVGVATWDKDKNCVCIVSAIHNAQEKYKFVYTHYERI